MIAKEVELTESYLFYVRMGGVLGALIPLSFVLLIVTNFTVLFLYYEIGIICIFSIGLAWYGQVKIIKRWWLYVVVISLIFQLLLTVYYAFVRYEILKFAISLI